MYSYRTRWQVARQKHMLVYSHSILYHSLLFPLASHKTPHPESNLTIKKPLNITNKKLSVKLCWSVLYDPKCWSLPCLVFFSTVFPTSLQVIENLLARSQKFQNPFCSVQIQWWKQELENLGTHDLLTLFLYMFCTIRLFFFKFVSLHFSYSLFLKYRWKSID